MHLSPLFRAVLLSCLACALWTMVVLFAWFIGNAKAQALQEAAHGALLEQQQARISSDHALVAATADERTQLQSLMQSDALLIADMFTSVGTQAGVDVEVSDASPESQNASSTDSAIDFTVKASGAFPKLTDALALMEEMPAPTTIQAFDLASVPASNAGSWQLEAHVRVLAAPSPSP